MKLSELIEALQRAQLGALVSDPEVTIEFDCNILDVISDNEGVHILAIRSMDADHGYGGYSSIGAFIDNEEEST